MIRLTEITMPEIRLPYAFSSIMGDSTIEGRHNHGTYFELMDANGSQLFDSGGYELLAR